MLPARECREAPVGPIPDDGVDARQVRQPVAQELAGGDDVMGAGGVHACGERQAQDLDEDRALGADRAATPATRLVERRPVTAALHRLGIDTTIDGNGALSWSSRTIAARRSIARAQTPFDRQRRHWAQTAVQGP